MDRNRLEDGLYLREVYKRHIGPCEYGGRVNVLEVLVALARRMEDLLDELDGEDRITMYFWEMIDNLGLSNFSDEVFRPDHIHRIERKLDTWMDRRFAYDGRGGLFPIREPKCDQRGVDIWYQANAYMCENY